MYKMVSEKKVYNFLRGAGLLGLLVFAKRNPGAIMRLFRSSLGLSRYAFGGGDPEDIERLVPEAQQALVEFGRPSDQASMPMQAEPYLAPPVLSPLLEELNQNLLAAQEENASNRTQMDLFKKQIAILRLQSATRLQQLQRFRDEQRNQPMYSVAGSQTEFQPTVPERAKMSDMAVGTAPFSRRTLFQQTEPKMVRDVEIQQYPLNLREVGLMTEPRRLTDQSFNIASFPSTRNVQFDTQVNNLSNQVKILSEEKERLSHAKQDEEIARRISRYTREKRTRLAVFRKPLPIDMKARQELDDVNEAINLKRRLEEDQNRVIEKAMEEIKRKRRKVSPEDIPLPEPDASEMDEKLVVEPSKKKQSRAEALRIVKRYQLRMDKKNRKANKKKGLVVEGEAEEDPSADTDVDLKKARITRMSRKLFNTKLAREKEINPERIIGPEEKARLRKMSMKEWLDDSEQEPTSDVQKELRDALRAFGPRMSK